MESPRSNKKILLLIIALIFVLLILWILSVLTAKPKITVDYVAEYNQMTRPENYDPNENAAEFYQKAFDAFVKMPPELRSPYKIWPSDFNSAEYAKLENWLASNAQAFEYFKIAADKPYYWLERHTDEDNNMMGGILLTDLNSLRHLTEAVLWNAKLSAYESRPEAAFNDILNCYRAGHQKCRTPSFLVEQIVGMDLKRNAVDTALLILDKTQFDSFDLKAFQDALQQQLDKDNYTLDFEADKMVMYDILQMLFTDNGRGTGRISWRAANFQAMWGWQRNLIIMSKLLFNCFFGPTRNEMEKRIEEEFASFEVLKTKTPWQLHKDDPNYFVREDKSHCDDYDIFIFNDQFFLATHRVFHEYYQAKTDNNALLTVLAILRFKKDNNCIPAALVELIDTGYLKYLPMDPYSNRPLVYKPEGDNFKLYSVGENFVDDDGSCTIDYGRPLDIVYWPFRKLEDPRKKITDE